MCIRDRLSTRLVLRGHDVTVYCREPYSDENWRGVHLRCLPALRHKYLETLHHTFVSTLDLLRHPHDVALFCNAANALFTPLPRLAGMSVALNVDGIERHRKKWNLAARCWYLMSEALATFCPNEIVTDAESIRDYYRARYGRDSWFIPYGAPVGLSLIHICIRGTTAVGSAGAAAWRRRRVAAGEVGRA